MHLKAKNTTKAQNENFESGKDTYSMFVPMAARHGEKHFRHKYTVKRLRLSTAHAVDQVELMHLNLVHIVNG